SEKRQVEQPFARIVDDVDGETPGRKQSVPAAGTLIIEGDAQFRDGAGRFGPGSVAHQRLNMVLVLEAGNGIVGLRLQSDAGYPVCATRLVQSQAPAIQQVVDERRDEDGLAGA